MARHRASTGRPRPGWRPSAGAICGTAAPSPRLADRGRHREAQRRVLAWLALPCRPSRPHPFNAATLTTLPAWSPRMPPASAEGPAAGHRARENRIAPLPAAHNRASKDPEPGTPDQEGRVIVDSRRYRNSTPATLRNGRAPVRWSPTARFGWAPHPIGEENDRSMRKTRRQIDETPAAGQVSAVPGDRKDENLHQIASASASSSGSG